MRPDRTPTRVLKHDILIDGRPFTVYLTGGRHASPDLHFRKDTNTCQQKQETKPSSSKRMRNCSMRESSPWQRSWSLLTISITRLLLACPIVVQKRCGNWSTIPTHACGGLSPVLMPLSLS